MCHFVGVFNKEIIPFQGYTKAIIVWCCFTFSGMEYVMIYMILLLDISVVSNLSLL